MFSWKEKVKLASDDLIILCLKQKLYGETVKRFCHWRNATIMTTAAFSHFTTAAWHIHITNASKHTGAEGFRWGGYCKRVDLIKQQAATVWPPPTLPPVFQSLPPLPLIFKWGEWVGMRLSDQLALAYLLVFSALLNYDSAGSGTFWVAELSWNITGVDSVWATGKPAGKNLSVSGVHDVFYRVMEIWRYQLGCDDKMSFSNLVL